MLILNQRNRALVTNLLSNFGYFGDENDKYFEKKREDFRRIMLMPLELSDNDGEIFEYLSKELGPCNNLKDWLYGPIVIMLVMKYYLTEDIKEEVQEIIDDTVYLDQMSLKPVFNERYIVQNNSNWCRDFISVKEKEGFTFNMKNFIQEYINEHPLKYRYKRKKTQTQTL